MHSHPTELSLIAHLAVSAFTAFGLSCVVLLCVVL